jgi:hypothetical protein
MLRCLCVDEERSCWEREIWGVINCVRNDLDLLRDVQRATVTPDTKKIPFTVEMSVTILLKSSRAVLQHP